MQALHTGAATHQPPTTTLDLDALPDGAYLTPRETAAVLKCSPGTLANSRANHSEKAKFPNRQAGMLFGVPAPRHFTFGRLVRYRAGDLREWLAQFEAQSRRASL